MAIRSLIKSSLVEFQQGCTTRDLEERFGRDSCLENSRETQLWFHDSNFRENPSLYSPLRRVTRRLKERYERVDEVVEVEVEIRGERMEEFVKS